MCSVVGGEEARNSGVGAGGGTEWCGEVVSRDRAVIWGRVVAREGVAEGRGVGGETHVLLTPQHDLEPLPPFPSLPPFPPVSSSFHQHCSLPSLPLPSL